MSKRLFELLVILTMVACAITFLREPDESSLIVFEPPKVDRGQRAQWDFELGDGLNGYEETLKLEVPQPTKEQMTQGAELYKSNCALCHGENGFGDGDGGASLDPPPRNLTAVDDYKYGRLEHGIFRTAKYGIEGTGMPPWDGILSEEELWAVTFHVRALQLEAR
jgi:mono/diheme cytochrome c family protein